MLSRPRSFALYLMMVTLGVLIIGCGEKSSEPVDTDTTPPATVADLRVESIGCDNVSLAWTAPGDDGTSGKATSYDVRYSTGAITGANWASATPCDGEPTPRTAGQTDSLTVTGLTSGTTYHFALVARDDGGNDSDVSNDASAAVGSTAIAWVNDGLHSDQDWWTLTASLSANWASACVSEYEYALGTSAGGTDVIGWTSAGTQTQVTRTSLGLVDDQTYYWSVRGVLSAVPGTPTTSDGIRVDSTAPISRVSALDATTVTKTFAVAWTGSDAGSGISHYDIQVKDGDGAWMDWVVATTLTEYDFTGETDHAYAFRSRAYDVAGRVEDYPDSADASTVVTCTYAYSLQWGQEGSGEGEFEYPYDLDVDAVGHVYVADHENDRVQVFDFEGHYLNKWGGEGHEDGEFQGAAGVAIDDSGYVYVTDFNNDRVQKFTSDGAFVAKWGSHGAADTQMIYPRGIAVDDSFYVYVAEQGNERIHKFTSKGVSVKTWGGEGTTDGEFRGLMSVDVGPSGDVYAVDAYNNRIQQFTSDGTFIRKWGSGGTGDGQFNSMGFVAVDPQGYVYVTESNGHRVQRFTSDGRFLTKWGSYGTGDGEFNEAWGIAPGIDGEVYIGDLHNHRVQLFLATCPY